MVTRVVIDNSVLIPLFFPDENAEFSDRIMSRAGAGLRLIAPRLALIEFGNAILKGVRHNRITLADGEAAVEDFARLPVEFVDFFTEVHLYRVLQLARRSGLTAYDATYLALALDQNTMLATHDSALRTAAKAERVELVA